MLRAASPRPLSLVVGALRVWAHDGEWNEQDPAWPLHRQLQRARHFKESIKFIHECRLKGEGCLVHCLAGVSRSVTLVTAYIMTITDFGWEDALYTVRAGRSCANPNLGFQRQLQEFEEHEVHQYRQWLKEEYGESPLQDAEEAKTILGKYKEQGHVEAQPGTRRWSGFSTLAPLSCSDYTTET
ncbi:dual specificity protein phosphatase 22 isoform X9 [Elephas maximus indicus]|uniref:dual specificity protein phosphatase 22 isoform X9 n=1 Tax=Elephas maximus indicus TaxID=99487 RepID=UPI002116AC70|nr:dual specificity protein phosphatase 22 isoform X9 [Elephas maximus indicus]